MKKSYVIVRRVLGSTASLDIAPDIFTSLVEAKDRLLHYISIEEKFGHIQSNYYEFESDLKAAAQREFDQSTKAYELIQGERVNLNRRLTNTLSACKAYIDYALKSSVNDLFAGGNLEAKWFESQFHLAYDGAFEYRLMEALRGHFQHDAFAIHLVTHFSKQWDEVSNCWTAPAVKVFAKTAWLRRDKQFKAAVLKELEQCDEAVELGHSIMTYVTALSTIHCRFRELVSKNVTKWEKAIESAISWYRESFPYEDARGGLSALEMQGDKILGEVQIFDDLIEYRRGLSSSFVVPGG